MPLSGAQTYPVIVPQLGGQLPWSHIKILLEKVSDHQEALFYIQQLSKIRKAKPLCHASVPAINQHLKRIFC